MFRFNGVPIVLSGLYNAATSDNPQIEQIERLLKGWCRTRVFVDGHDAIIKTATHPSVMQVIEKYERPNEFAIAMLAGKLNMMNNGNSISYCTFF